MILRTGHVIESSTASRIVSYQHKASGVIQNRYSFLRKSTEKQYLDNCIKLNRSHYHSTIISVTITRDIIAILRNVQRIA